MKLLLVNNQSYLGNFIASGDAEGCIIVWKMEKKPTEVGEAMELGERKEMTKKAIKEAENERQKSGDPEMDLPLNKEHWIRAFRAPIRHGEDITGLCWSPDSSLIASVAMDDKISVHRADNGIDKLLKTV